MPDSHNFIPLEENLAKNHPVRDWTAWNLYSAEMVAYRDRMGIPQPEYPAYIDEHGRPSEAPTPLTKAGRPRRPRGGRRPGAGAPRGNLNALKHGSRSKRVARGCLVLALIPEVLDALRVFKADTRDPVAYQRKLAESI